MSSLSPLAAADLHRDHVRQVPKRTYDLLRPREGQGRFELGGYFANAACTHDVAGLN